MISVVQVYSASGTRHKVSATWVVSVSKSVRKICLQHDTERCDGIGAAAAKSGNAKNQLDSFLHNFPVEGEIANLLQ